MARGIIYKTKDEGSTEAILNKIADGIDEQARQRLIKIQNDREFQNHIKELKREQYFNKGWSRDRNRRWIGRIPQDVRIWAGKVYGEENLLKDKKLYKKVFAPWLIVDPESV